MGTKSLMRTSTGRTWETADTRSEQKKSKGSRSISARASSRTWPWHIRHVMPSPSVGRLRYISAVYA